MSEDNVKASAEEDENGASSSDESSEGEEVPIESLVAGRVKRGTAGNRMSTLLEKEHTENEGDEELELLFAEDEEEEDVEFEGLDDDASDVQLDLSSDEDDHGPTYTGDDLDGEKELQKQDRLETRKKRKAQEVFKRPAPLRKKFKVDTTVTPAANTAPPPRPKKKSERISWVPTPDEGPTRSSSRKQTVQNKEVVHLRMQESEKRRRQQLRVMEAAAKRKDASKPRTMTQADRMAEAARTEERNAKSLNRWEETEQKRADEQKARLAALHNRQLQGPVISWWSGVAKWVNGRLVQTGFKTDKQASRKAERKEKPDNAASQVGSRVEEGAQTVHKDVNTSIVESQLRVESNEPLVPAPASASESAENVEGSIPSIVSHDSKQGAVVPDAVTQEKTDPVSAPQPATSAAYGTLHAFSQHPQITIEHATRNLVVLENIDANAVRIPELQNHVLLRKKLGKLQSEYTSYAMEAC